MVSSEGHYPLREGISLMIPLQKTPRNLINDPCFWISGSLVVWISGSLVWNTATGSCLCWEACADARGTFAAGGWSTRGGGCGSFASLALEEASVAFIGECKSNGIGVIAISILGKGKADHGGLKQSFAAVRTLQIKG